MIDLTSILLNTILTFVSIYVIILLGGVVIMLLKDMKVLK